MSSQPAPGGAGPAIPEGYETATAAARRQGISPQVLRRRLREEPGFARSLGARKIPWRGPGLWVLPREVRIPTRSVGQPRRGTGSRANASGGQLLETERREIAQRAHAGEKRAPLAREYGIDRSYVYSLMRRYPPAGSAPPEAYL